METITIKDGSKKYNATLMFIGKLVLAWFFRNDNAITDHYLFWVADFCNIYSMDKLHYSIVKRKNIDQNAKVMDTITIKDRSKKYNATLMFTVKLIHA